MPRVWAPGRLALTLLLLAGLALRVAPVWGEEATLAEQTTPGQIGAADTCPCTFGPLITDTAVPLEQGKFAVQPLWALGFTGGAFNTQWRRASAGGDFLSLSLPVKFTYGLIKNVETYVIVPYVHNWAWNVDPPGPGGERAANFGGLGDVTLTLKYQLVEEGDYKPAISGLFTVGFPTGRHNHLNPSLLGTDDLGLGAYVFTAGFNVSKWVKPFILYGNLWYSQATACKVKVEGSYERERRRDYLTLNLAVEYPIGGKGPWVLLFEYNSYYDMGPLLGGRGTTPPAARLGMLPGLEYVVSDKLALALGVAVDLAGKNTAIKYTPMLSFTYIF